MRLHDRVFLLKMTMRKARTERKKKLLFTCALFLAVTLSLAIGYIVGNNAHRTPIIIQKCPPATGN